MASSSSGDLSSTNGTSVSDFIAMIQGNGPGSAQVLYCSPKEYERLTGRKPARGGFSASIILGDKRAVRDAPSFNMILRPHSSDSFVVPKALIPLTDEQTVVIRESMLECRLSHTFLEDMHLIDFLLFQYVMSAPRSKYKEEILGVAKQIGSLLKNLFVSFANNKAREIFDTARDYAPLIDEVYEKYARLQVLLGKQNKPLPPICEQYIALIQMIVDQEFENFVAVPLFRQMSDLFPDFPRYSFTETIPFVIRYIELQRDIQKKQFGELHDFYEKVRLSINQIRPDDEGFCDMSGITRECFAFSQVLEKKMDRTKNIAITTYARFFAAQQGIKQIGAFAASHARYAWKITTKRWREHLRELFEVKDKFMTLPLSYQESPLFKTLEEDVHLLQREIVEFIQYHFDVPFSVYSENYQRNQRLYDELPQIVTESFQGKREISQQFFIEIKEKLALIRRRFLEYRYTQANIEDELLLIPTVMEELMPNLTFLVMILRDSDTLFGGEVPRSELMEDLFPEELLGLMKLSEYTGQYEEEVVSRPKVEEVAIKEEVVPAQVIQTRSPEPAELSIASSVIKTVDRIVVKERQQLQTKFSFEEAKEQFKFEELTLIEEKEESRKYYDAASNRVIEVFGSGQEQGTSFFTRHAPLLKFREVFGRYFPGMDKNVNAEEVRRMLDKDESRFRFDHSTGSHAIYVILETGENFPVPRGNNEGVLPSGTLKSIRYSMAKALIVSLRKELEKPLSEERAREIRAEIASLEQAL